MEMSGGSWVLLFFLGLLFISVLSYYLGGGRLLAAFQKKFPDAKKTLDEWNSLLPKKQGRYFTHRQTLAWRTKWNSLLSAAARLPDKLAPAPEPDASTKVIQQIMALALLPDSETARSKANKAWVQSQLKKHSKWFDSVWKTYSLSEEQRISAVIDEDRNLIVAGAGTGKTSAIVGKVGYLIEEGITTESDILLLSFNDKVAKELKNRIRVKCGLEVEARTFHSFGLHSIGEATGHKPSLSKLADNKDDLMVFIQNTLTQIANGPNSKQLSYFIALLLIPYYTIEDLDGDPKRFLRYKRALKNRTINGEKVKSLEEMRIANWLYLNGVQYRYEGDYEHDTRDSTHRQYTPDFYLPEYEIYIEHYGLDMAGNTPVGIDRETYHERKTWHEEIHRKYGTTLVKTYSWHHSEGAWQERLSEELSSHGVEFKETHIPNLDETLRNELSKHEEITLEEESIAALLRKLRNELSEHGVISEEENTQTFSKILRKELKNHGVVLEDESIERLSLDWMKELEAISQLAKLMNGFLNLYKSKFGGGTAGFETIRNDPNYDIAERDTAFLDLFKLVLEDYQAALNEEGKIDFNDMIHDAADAIRKGHVKPNYQYVIVDEFQDISQARADLILAVLEANPEARLFAVGDDWQSIYRFTGSDLTLMTDFDNTFGKAIRLDLTRAFRFSQESLDVSSIFIQKNPNQLEKDLSSEKVTGHPTVTIIDNSIDAFRKASQKLSPAPEEIKLLSRYKFSELSWLKELKENKSKLTVHSSKGLEADYVILIDLEANTLGFPSQVEDDPVLRLLFPADDDYRFGEERRLFYVALTRAIRHTFLIAPSNIPPSEFLDELREMGTENPGLIEDLSRLGKAIECPLCKAGGLVKRTNSKTGKVFFSCEFYPVCEGKIDPCPECQKQPIQRKNGEWSCAECGYKAIECARCKKGYLREKINSKTGKAFFSCSTFPACKCTANLCPECQEQPIQRKNGEWACTGCDYEPPKCPLSYCEGYLHERINSKTGETFIGCSEFPDCRYTRPNW